MDVVICYTVMESWMKAPSVWVTQRMRISTTGDVRPHWFVISTKLLKHSDQLTVLQ